MNVIDEESLHFGFADESGHYIIIGGGENEIDKSEKIEYAIGDNSRVLQVEYDAIKGQAPVHR